MLIGKLKTIAIRTIIVCVLSYIIAIIFALKGFSYYSLVFQSITSAILNFLWNYLSTKPKFKFKFRMEGIHKIISYSTYDLGFNVINYFARNLDNLLTGKLMGSSLLGIYNKAYSLIQMMKAKFFAFLLQMK